MEEIEFRYDTQLLIEGENLDEDEMERFLRGGADECAYFRLDDEYGVVRKQN